MKLGLPAIALLAALLFVVGFWPRVSLLALCCLDVLSGRESAPVAMFETTSVDLGRIAATDPVRATFRVTNAGAKRLVLERKSPGCQCEHDLHSTVIVPPATTMDLIVPLHGMIENGTFVRRITYYTSDPVLPVVTLTVRAEMVSGASEGLTPVPDSGIPQEFP